MTFKTRILTAALLLLAFSLLSACVTPPAAATPPPSPQIEYIVSTATPPPATSTPDPCAAENIKAEVLKIHAYMREFDDASTLAANRPREELAASIADLQRIRRAAEDQATPSCLATLKLYQVSHMNTVINTLIAFMGGADQATVDQGIALARDQHDRYTLELARLLGATIEPAATIIAPSQTPNP